MSITLPEGAPAEVVTHALRRDLDLEPFGISGNLAIITLDNALDYTRPNTFGPESLMELRECISAAAAVVAAEVAVGVPLNAPVVVLNVMPAGAAGEIAKEAIAPPVEVTVNPLAAAFTVAVSLDAERVKSGDANAGVTPPNARIGRTEDPAFAFKPPLPNRPRVKSRSHAYRASYSVDVQYVSTPGLMP